MAAMAGSTKNTSQDDIQKIIRSYFIQLTSGCGNSKCKNPKCVTGGGAKPMEANKAAAKAVVLAKEDKNGVCTFALSAMNPNTSKMSSPHRQDMSSSSPNSSSASCGSSDEPMEIESTTNIEKPPQNSSNTHKGLSEEDVVNLTSSTKDDASYHKQLMDVLYNTFSSPEMLNQSFLHSFAIDDSKASSSVSVDIASVRRMYTTLYETNTESVVNVLVNAMNMYCNSIKQFSNLNSASLNHIVILFENPLLHSPEFLESAFPKFLSVIMSLSVDQKAILVQWYSNYPISELNNFVSALQQVLTISILQIEDPSSKSALQTNTTITSATHVMMIFYVANLVIGKRNGDCRPHSDGLLSEMAAPLPEDIQQKTLSPFEMLLMKCDVHPAEIYNTPIKLTDFVNESINNGLNMLTDYKRHNNRMASSGSKKALGKWFSFLDHPYILDPANKVEKLYFDNQVSMINERNRTLLHVLVTGVAHVPFLLLRVDRNNLVSDTLAQLEAIAEFTPSDLRKQLRVEFKDEEGIDEGGVQKEFFQLLIEKLFDPMNGMFVHDNVNHFHWFNLDSLESEQQYHLIGILLGLAIYNNVILDVRFPLVVYHKLIGCNTVFNDLYSTHPQIAQSLQSMLDFKPTNGTTFEDTFMSTFSVSYTDMYSCQQTINLKENGDKIPVTADNVKEFVKLYSDWLLNKSIEKQFDQFKKGFDVVMGDSNLADLFTAEEVELLVCGDKEWDFNTLEENTQYDGFTKSHQVIQNFWEIFYEFSDERKKQLLAFVTGSDRVPVGGLAKMKMVIVKNGPDSDRLPTAHTCFNALLLCNYSTKEKLKERLEKAIENGKGFGML